MVPTTEKVWDEFNAGLKHFILKRVPDEPGAEDILQFSRVGTPLGGENPGCASSYCV
ncbi:MAG TPA: hypothetical protein VFZ02_03980 [Ktedonobacteraceae bacterium]